MYMLYIYIYICVSGRGWTRVLKDCGGMLRGAIYIGGCLVHAEDVWTRVILMFMCFLLFTFGIVHSPQTCGFESVVEC